MCNETQKNMQRAYDLLNAALFNDRLPECVILIHRKRGARGYFWPEQWQSSTGDVRHEISLNPETFSARSTEDILSTLAHEMCHLEQQVYGKPSRNGYHNREWADMMERIGLIPSDTGEPGGKRTGQRMTHYIEPAGPFAAAAAHVISEIGEIQWSARGKGKSAAKRASKTKYSCPSCGQNAWAKPDASLACGDCACRMTASL